MFKLNKLKVKLIIFNGKNIKKFFLLWNTKNNNLIDEISIEKCGFEFEFFTVYYFALSCVHQFVVILLQMYHSHSFGYVIHCSKRMFVQQ